MVGVLGFIYTSIPDCRNCFHNTQDCIQLSTRTFFAVYLSIAILGFSRGAFFVLDPFSILGFINNSFTRWVIVSRFLAILGFPSLVAACTLIILTLARPIPGGSGIRGGATC